MPISRFAFCFGLQVTVQHWFWYRLIMRSDTKPFGIKLKKAADLPTKARKLIGEYIPGIFKYGIIYSFWIVFFKSGIRNYHTDFSNHPCSFFHVIMFGRHLQVVIKLYIVALHYLINNTGGITCHAREH